MKILELGKFYPIRGGVEKVMWDLARGISARGIDCDMLCAMLPGDRFDEADSARGTVDGSMRTITFNEHGHCYCVKALKKVAATMISPAMVGWLRKHKAEYDVIHVHHPDPMACLALWLSGYRGKVVLHWHSDILKQKGLLTLYRPLQSWLIRRADLIVGTTPVYVAQSHALAGVQDKVTYLPIGIEDNIRSASGTESEEAGQHRVTVFSLGRLVEYKGFEYLIDAAQYLPDNYRVLIGGKGPLMEQLQQRIDSLGVNVKLLGFLSDGQVYDLYNTSDLFVLSSVMKTEAFGIVQIEAMSCGKPVVATHIPGSGTDWVNADGESGLNVPCRDPRALADAIVKICGDSDVYARFSAGARSRYEKLYTYQGMIDGAVAFYEKVLEK